MVLILIYAIQDFQTSRNTTAVVGASRVGVHLALFVMLMVLGIHYFLTTIRVGVSKSPVMIALWLITIWIALVNFIQNSISWGMAVHLGLSTLWILVYYFFCYYIRKFPDVIRQMKVCIGMLFCFYVFSAVYAMNAIHAYLVYQGQNRLAVVNMVYGVMVFMPWLTLLDKKKYLFSLGIVFIVVLVSMKRGAVIAFPLMLSTSILVEAYVNKKGLIRPALKIIMALIIFFVGLLAADQFSNGFLSKRFSSKDLADGSGRVNLYQAGLEIISQRSFEDLMIGRGSGSSEKVVRTAMRDEVIGASMHNEWIEFLFSFGVLGVMFYMLLFCTLVGKMLKLIKISSSYAPAYAMAIVYIFTVGMVGQIYFAHSTLYLMAFFGVAEGMMLNDAQRERELMHTKKMFEGR